MKQQIGLRAQMNDTYRQPNIAPKPSTVNMPKAAVIGAIDIIMPRTDVSLCVNMKWNDFIRWIVGWNEKSGLNYLISLT